MAIKLPGGRALAVVTVGVLAGTLFTAGGSAVASSAGAEIHACVHKQTRYARIVNATAKCKPTEVRVRWGQQGESQQQGIATAGPQGERGPQGQQGVKGDPGSAGPQGLRGPIGRTGATGPQGAKGETGAQGPKGEDGKDGAPGAKGLDGKDGADGKPGAQGPAGKDGKDGAGSTLTIVTVTKSYNFGSHGGSETVGCGTGKVVTGGGFSGSGSASGQIYTSAPSGTGWTVGGKNSSGTVYAICMS
ncbi:hypothetical protein [Streptosporangium sp. CA-115845]|uniref:hypothetical protein n=1 Tax=Streptosporangium sp. CA-115845 TaxID=3240071 RepID=UPI003D8AE8E3